MGEEEPEDGEAVGQQPKHLLGVLGHPADIYLARRLLLALLLRGLVEHKVLESLTMVPTRGVQTQRMLQYL